MLTLIDPAMDVTQASTDDGSTPLFMACQEGHLEVVLALLEKAHDTILVNQVRAGHGATPLVQKGQAMGV